MHLNRIFILSLLFLMAQAMPSRAQFLPTSNLTVFSEDGYKFFLILNGERQNEVAQTNVRIEELPMPYYNCKIIFEDKSQNEISKNNLMVVDVDGIHQDVTYKIKKDKNGKQVLRFHSNIPAVQNMMRPANAAVYRFGNPNMIIAGPGFTQTTTTVGTRGGNGSVGVQMNGGGLGVNVQIQDPLVNNSMTTTTTTTTTTRGGNQGYYNEQPAMQGCVNAYPMSNGDFNSAKQTVKNEGFDETRLDIAKQIAGSNCLNTGQIIALCQELSFEKSKLDFAKFAYDYCVDPRNYFKVSNIFSFSSSKQELNNYIQGR